MAKIIQLIETEDRRGTGTAENPVRLVRQLFTTDGVLVHTDSDPYDVAQAEKRPQISPASVPTGVFLSYACGKALCFFINKYMITRMLAKCDAQEWLRFLGLRRHILKCFGYSSCKTCPTTPSVREEICVGCNKATEGLQ